jgi:transcription termination factor 2
MQLEMSSHRVPRRIFGHERDDVMEGWRKLHNEELHNLYSSSSIIRIIMSRKIRWAGHVARMWEKRNAYRILVGKPEDKRPLGRAISRWVDNIKMDLRDIGWDGMDWIDLAQDRDQWMAVLK